MLHRIIKAVDPYIALMAATVGAAILLPAEGATAKAAAGLANAAIVFLFFLYGARLATQAVWDGLRQWRLHLAILASTYFIFPLLGLGATALLPPALSAGFLFLCLLPSTVQSSIAFTSIARGNIPAALCSASASNMIGVVATPLLAGWLLHATGAELSLQVFASILLQLVLPFVAGQLLRRWIGTWVQSQKRILGYLDRGAILLIIYVAFSRGMTDRVWEQLRLLDLVVLVLLLAALLGLMLAITATLARRVLRLRTEDEIVLVFCGSKKSLASGLPMASVLFAGPQLSLVVLPVMLFHQMQLIVCASIARRYSVRQDAGAALPADAQAA